MFIISYKNRIQIDERLAWLYEEIYKLDEIDRSITLLLLDNFSYKEMFAIAGSAAALIALHTVIFQAMLF